MNPMLILGAVAATIITGLGLYAWDADSALARDKKALVAAELQRDQYQKAVVDLRNQINDKNRILADVSMLPEVRLRLCAQRPATDGCCDPKGQCTP